MYRNFIHAPAIQERFYNKGINIPDSVTIVIQDNCIIITGKLGNLTHILHKSIGVDLKDHKYLNIYSKTAHFHNKAIIGTTCSLINGIIIGVVSGFVKKLQLIGIGYRAHINTNNVINLTIGLSHPVDYVLPKGITAQCLNNTEIILKSINKQLIGQVAANLRAICPPEPFKGKGIRYANEIVRVKDTKKR